MRVIALGVFFVAGCASNPDAPIDGTTDGSAGAPEGASAGDGSAVSDPGQRPRDAGSDARAAGDASGSPVQDSATDQGATANPNKCPYAAIAAAHGIADDGCAGAPAGGPPQYPTLLDKYGSNRPPWDVAGVDYYVGVPSGQALKDWQTLKTSPPAGLEWDPRGNLRCNSGNVVLDGYDFTTGTAAFNFYAPADGCTGLAITNSKMGCIPGAGTGQDAPAFGGFNIQSTKMAFTFKNNTVDYSDCQGSGGAIMGLITVGNMGCTGCTMDVEYNYVRNLFDTFLGFGGSYASFIHRYNVIENPATSEPGDPSKVHMNSLSGLASGTYSPVFTFNTTFASQSYAGGELPQFYYNGGGTIDSPTVTNNTFPLSACKCVSYKVHGNTGYSSKPTNLTGTGVISQNYFDTTDAYGPFYPGSFKGWTASGNIDMNTGATITPP